MLDSWGTGGSLDLFRMGTGAGGAFGVLGLLLYFRYFGVHPILSIPLFLSDSGPAPFVCTLLRALTSVRQEPQPSAPCSSYFPVAKGVSDKSK